MNPAVESLRNELQAALAAGLRCYALVDGALARDVDRRLPRTADVAIVRPRGVTGADADHVLPHLVVLSKDNHQFNGLVDATFCMAEDTHAATWLISNLSRDALASELAGRHHALLPDNMAVLLRYADARVLSVLASVLDPRQREAFFGLARTWWYLDRHGALQSISRHDENTSSESFTSPLRLDAKQQCAMIDAAEPDVVLAMLWQQAGGELDAMSNGEQYELVRGQIAVAQRFGIEGAKDFLLFCLAALSEGPDFCEKSPFKERLGMVKAGELKLRDALAGRHSS